MARIIARITRTLALCRDRGMTTAEYAVGTLGAVAFALVLIGIARSDAIRGAIAAVIVSALGSR